MSTSKETIEEATPLIEVNHPVSKCFIITPIGQLGKPMNREAMGIVSEVLKPVLMKFGAEEVITAVDFDTGLITNKIIEAIHSADLIIANLTEQNPNVMYELALAHAFKKRVVHILRSGEAVPFDISQHKYINYVDDIQGTKELKSALEKAVTSALNEDEDSISNPVVDALSTFTIVQPKSTEKDMPTLMQELLDRMDGLEKNNDYLRTTNSGLSISNRPVHGQIYKDLLESARLENQTLRLDPNARLILQGFNVSDNTIRIAGRTYDIDDVLNDIRAKSENFMEEHGKLPRLGDFSFEDTQIILKLMDIDKELVSGLIKT